MSKKLKSLGVVPAALIAIVALGAFVGIAAVMTNNQSGIFPVSFAKDGEDEDEDEDEKENEDEDEDEDEDEKENEDENENEDDDKDESAKKASEIEKKKLESQREQVKKALEAARKQAEDDDEDIDDYEDDNETIKDLNEVLAEADKDVAEAKAEGVNVTKALATIAEAKLLAKKVQAAYDAGDFEEAKRLAQEVKKLTHFAKEEDTHNAKEIGKAIDKVAKRIDQARGKIYLLGTLGGDTKDFTTLIDQKEEAFKALQTKIAQESTNLSANLAELEVLERSIKRIKSSVESTIYAMGGTDEEYDDDYQHESEDVAEKLRDIADIEGDGVGHEVSTVANEQIISAIKVSDAIKNVDQRNQVLQVLFGTRRSELEKIDGEIANNKIRIEKLTLAADKIDDQEVKDIVLAQVQALQEETSKLETFVSGQKNRLSAFGWFFNLF